jgi:hypothetical protein
MNLITSQDEWIEHCQSRYLQESPEGYHFEGAHYPLSEKLGGTEKVPLWYPDHIVQGCLQTLNLNYPCIDTRKEHLEREIIRKVYPEYLDVYEKAYKLCKSYAGKLGSQKTVSQSLGCHSDAYRTSEKYLSDRSKAGLTGGKTGGEKSFDTKTGIHSEEYRNSSKSKEDHIKNGKKVGGANATLKRGVCAPGVASKGGEIGGRETSSQVWESTEDGFRGNAGNVAKHNKSKGWDPDARVRIDQGG